MSGLRSRFLRDTKAAVVRVERRRSSADTAADSTIADAKRRLAEHGMPVQQRPDVERGTNRVIGESMMRVAKREPLKTTMTREQAKAHVSRVGAAGPLPKHLSREERMKAYEARYVHAGGPRGEKWKHVATGSDAIKTTGLATATALGGVLLASRSTKGAKLLKKIPRTTKHAENVGIGAATAGGAGELVGDFARRRQSKSTNAPAGVAGGALRRMRAYPGGQ